MTTSRSESDSCNASAWRWTAPRWVRVIVFGLVVCSCWSLTGAALAQEAVEIEGEWYVLVHFSEAVEGGTRIDDFRDAVWRFERRGDRLDWTVFSEVGFRDESGRYEQVRGQRVRIAHTWWPTAPQLDEIRSGLGVVERTARKRTLRRKGGDGWRSGGAARPGSASAVSYGETWSIEGLGGMPAFERSASLDSGRASGLSGVTRFEAESLDAGAGRIEGRYARDENESGRFVMWKKGVRSASDVRFVQASREAGFFGPGGAARMSVVELTRQIESGDGSRANRLEIRAGIQALVEESFTRRGLPLHPHASEIEGLVTEIERLAVVEGVPLSEIDRRYEAGEIEP